MPERQGLVMPGVGQGLHPGGFGNGRPGFSQIALGTGSRRRQSWGAVHPRGRAWKPGEGWLRAASTHSPKPASLAGPPAQAGDMGPFPGLQVTGWTQGP